MVKHWQEQQQSPEEFQYCIHAYTLNLHFHIQCTCATSTFRTSNAPQHQQYDDTGSAPVQHLDYFQMSFMFGIGIYVGFKLTESYAAFGWACVSFLVVIGLVSLIRKTTHIGNPGVAVVWIGAADL